MVRHLAALLFCLGVQAVHAGPAEVDRMIALTRIGDVVEIMAEEGRIYGAELKDNMFPDNRIAGWQAQLDTIYDPARMEEAMRARLHGDLDDTDLTQILAFMESAVGQQTVALEIGARRALLDEEAMEAARLHADRPDPELAPRLDQIARFIAVNDLIERNIQGGLNSNFAFMAGLADGGGMPIEMTEDDILREVWMSEPDLRSDTVSWLLSYLLMAYEPLTDDQMNAYLDACQTKAGQAWVRGNFDAFDALFIMQSRALGLAVADQLRSESL